MDTEKDIHTASLVKKTLSRIESERVTPRPKWQFLLKNWVFWLFAILSIILGAIAVATIIFLFIDQDAATRVYLNESVFEDLLQTIPYLWVATLAMLVGISQYAVRHTDRGYRYTSSRVIAGVVIGSVLLGTALNFMEVGEHVQDFLTERTPYYDELVHTSKDSWSQPEKGLLGGIVTGVTGEELTLTDFHNKKWHVDLGNIDQQETSLLQLGSTVKILGSPEDASTFRAVRIFSFSRNKR